MPIQPVQKHVSSVIKCSYNSTMYKEQIFISFIKMSQQYEQTSYQRVVDKISWLFNPNILLLILIQ